ncbi:flagellar motor protein MotB [Pseudomaricurvus sp. HS19]|uniref:OmpA/MotB family protein n=1 Tax=Pseudomaricurvus sp. HS19 TaxID=2692626 RepID=UPI00351A0F71
MDEENPYWISFSDIMAGLLVIFVLAAIALVLELTQLKEKIQEDMSELARAEQVRRDILKDIVGELNSMKIPVKLSENDTVIRIPNDVLSFRQRSFNLPDDKRSLANALAIGEVIYKSIRKENRWKYLDTVFVEGHTDRAPYSNQAIKGNWGLSTFRAISVWDYWNSEMPEGSRLDELKNHVGKKLFSVSGYAETRPVSCSNASPDVDNQDVCPRGRIDSLESLKMNRRIDIRFTVKLAKSVDIREKLSAY